MTENETKPRSSARKWIWLAIRIAVGVGALVWTVSRVDVADISDALSRMGGGAFALAVALTFGNLAVGSVRWRTLLAAYGSSARPPLLFLARIYLVGLFYNTFLPGNVGGDLVRAHATRDAFAGGAGAYVIVMVERIFGLAGLLLLGASVIMVHPVGGVAHLPLLAAAGIAAALGAAMAPAIARRLAPRLPGRIGKIAGDLPAVKRPALLALVLLLSVGTQTVVALTGHALVSSVHPTTPLGDSLVLVPIAMIAVYFPFTVAGLGVREAAFVGLFSAVGVPAADATAASLAFLGVQMLVALAGGLVHVAWPVTPRDNPAE